MMNNGLKRGVVRLLWLVLAILCLLLGSCSMDIKIAVFCTFCVTGNPLLFGCLLFLLFDCGRFDYI